MQSKVTCSLSQVVHKQGGEAESVRSLKLSSDRKLLVRSQGALLDFRFSILVHEILQQSVIFQKKTWEFCAQHIRVDAIFGKECITSLKCVLHLTVC